MLLKPLKLFCFILVLDINYLVNVSFLALATLGDMEISCQDEDIGVTAVRSYFTAMRQLFCHVEEGRMGCVYSVKNLFGAF